jgi:RNA polymerase sigma-70 factor (ECF subfamily)
MPCDESDTDDAILVSQTLSGEKDAFSRLFLRYYERIRAHAYRIVLDAHLADDIAQETFIRAASRLSGLRDRQAFGAWLFQISGNISKDKLRSRTSYSDRIGEFAKMESLSSQAADPHGRDSDLVHQAVKQLPPKQREAVALVWMQNKTHAEASRIADCAESTISWRLALAKQTLRKFLNS